MYIKAQDMASGVMAKVGASVDMLKAKTQALVSGGLNSMNNTFQRTGELMRTGLVVGLTGAISLMGLLGGMAVKNSANFEIYRATLTTMLGSQELANKRLQEYADIGKSTPFELPQVVELGNQLQALGKYSRDNVIMLGDLAAAAGKPIEQVGGAFAKLASGQKGIAVDMFRDLLITTDDWVKATGKGISKSGELMATTEEMMAVLPKIMKDKNFSGMMANQAATFTGKMSNLMDTFNSKLTVIGDKLLPVIKPYIDRLIEYIDRINIDEIIANISNGLNQARTFFQPVVDYFSTRLDQLNAILVGLGGVGISLLVGGLIAMVAPIIAAVAPFVALAAVIGGLYYLWQNQGIIMEFFKQQLDVVYNWLMTVWQFIQSNFKPLLDTLAKTWQTMVNTVQLLMPGLMALGAFLFFLGATIVQLVIFAFQQLWPVLQQLGLVFLELWNAVMNLWNAIAPILIPILMVLAGIIVAVLYPVFVYLVTLIINVVKAIGEMLSGVIQIFSGLINFVVGVFTGNWTLAWEGIKQIVMGFWKFLVGAVGFIISPFTSIIDGIKNIFGSFNLFQIGVNMIQGFINGVTNMAGPLIDKVKGTINDAIQGAKNLLGIKSPSRVFMKIGEQTSEGMAIGVGKGAPKVKKATDEMLDPEDAKGKPKPQGVPSNGGGTGGMTIVMNFYGATNDEKGLREFIRSGKQVIIKELGLDKIVNA